MYLTVDLEGMSTYTSENITQEEIDYCLQGSSSVFKYANNEVLELVIIGGVSTWISIEMRDKTWKIANFGSATDVK